MKSVLRGYFSTQWKVAQIILIPKPGKPSHQLSSYRPILLIYKAILKPNWTYGIEL
jgi:hypothetical protein